MKKYKKTYYNQPCYSLNKVVKQFGQPLTELRIEIVCEGIMRSYTLDAPLGSILPSLDGSVYDLIRLTFNEWSEAPLPIYVRKGSMYDTDDVKSSYIDDIYNYDRQLVYIFGFLLEYRCLTGDAWHYYISTPELLDFCSKAKPVPPVGLEYYFLSDLFTIQEDTIIVFHTPNDPRYSLIVWSIPVTIHEDNQVIGKDHLLALFRYDEVPAIISMNNLVDFDHKEAKEELAFIFSLGVYLKCFPSALVEGLCLNMQNPNYHKHNKVLTVQSVPQIVERSGPVPHYRSGHFRILSSPRYVNKQYDIIFVRDTFVKGAVKTVVDRLPKSEHVEKL